MFSKKDTFGLSRTNRKILDPPYTKEDGLYIYRKVMGKNINTILCSKIVVYFDQ